MKKLYFARHGLSEFNVQGKFAGRTDTPLTDEGRNQARLAGIKAKDLGIDLIAASPLSRALETAQIIARGIGYSQEDILVHKLFIERDFGELEGKQWSPDLNLDGFSDIETNDTLIERAHLSLNLLKRHGAENVLVVSHGAFGRALRSILKQEYPMSRYKRLQNAEIMQWM